MPSLKAMAREAQKKPKPGVPHQAPSRKQTVFKSTERVADSDLESETESESDSDSGDSSAIAPIPVAKLNGQKLKPVATPREAESEGEDEEEDESESQESVVVPNSNSVANDQRSDESESGGNGSSGSESESSEHHLHGTAGIAAEKTSSHVQEEIQAKPDKPRAVPMYNPPDGFTITSGSNDGRQKVAEVFGRSNLAGKQLWYITAPASVPISEMKQVSLQDIQLGKPALYFCGRDYAFVQDQAGKSGCTKALIPDANTAAYRVGPKGVDQTLHLQQVVQLQKNADTSSPNFGVPANVAKRPVRKQPEGLKMRFRPIGFGTGKTGSIGLSSSSSDSSSSTDSDADMEMQVEPPVSRQPLDLGQANTRLSEEALNASGSQDNSSSSGEETDDTSAVAQVDPTSDSDSSSEPSNDKTEDGTKATSAPKNSPSSSPRPLKRKLSDFKKDEKTSYPLHSQVKPSAMPLKKANIKTAAPAPTPEGSASKLNGNAKTTGKSNLSTFPSKTTQVLPPRASGTHSSSVSSSKPKATPIPLPRKSAILPPGRESISPNVSRDTRAARPELEMSPGKVSGTQLPSGMKSQRNLEDRLQSTDSALSEKERKREMRRLKEKNAGQISKNQRAESTRSATDNTIDKSRNSSPPTRDAHHRSLEASSSTKKSAEKALSQDVKSSRMEGMEKVSKKPKKYPSNPGVHDENGGTPRSSQAVPTTSPSPRKESVILPPKFVRSMSRFGLARRFSSIGKIKDIGPPLIQSA